MPSFTRTPRRGSTFKSRIQTLGPLDAAQQNLAEGAVKLGFSKAYRARKRARADLQELIGVSLLGLVEAAWRFDEKVGPPFAGYAAMIIDQRLRRAGEKERRVFRPGMPDFFDAEDYRTTAPDKAAIAKDVVEKLKAEIPAEEFEIMWRYYALGKSLQEIADERGITRQAVHQRARRARRHARRVFPELVNDAEM